MLSDFNYTSNTTAGCANQHYFESDGSRRVGRAYFRIFAGGEYNYSLLFSGILDGSYRRLSFHDEPCSDWIIHSAKVGRLKAFPEGVAPESITENAALSPEWLAPLTFDGKRSREADAALFYSDPVRLAFNKDEYLCLELEYSGKRIPCHPEVTIPIYNLVKNKASLPNYAEKAAQARAFAVGSITESLGDTVSEQTENAAPNEDASWEYTVNMPLPCMIGCDRPVKERIAYLGDSITQGADLPVGSYDHWASRLAERLGAEFSHWNLGIGLGKASDVAQGGVWYQKAASQDTVFVCYGVNDINSDYEADYIKICLYAILKNLKSLGKKVVLQTVPPFNYPEPRRTVWHEVNRYIKEELSKIADRVFDPNYILSLSPDEPHITRFGGHPSPEGCALWAEALYSAISDLFA